MGAGELDSNAQAYQLTAAEDGLWLTVNPAGEGQAPPDVDVVIAAVRGLGYKEVKGAAVAEAVRAAAGTPVKLSEPMAVLEPDVQVVVARDRLEAFLQIHVPKGARSVLIDEVLEKVKAAGVVFGVDSEAILKAVESQRAKTVIARGKPPVDGQDGMIRYCLDLEAKGQPKTLEDGRVDYRSLNLFVSVCEGDVLAQKIPATHGEPGCDVLGQTLAPKKGKEVVLPLGKNTRLEEDKLIAAQSGHLLLTNGKLSVVSVLEVKKDVDLSTGNIDYSGNVVIGGSVQQGFSVKAGGNVEVRGAVCGGIVEGRNITVCHGVQGMNSGALTAAENVHARFIENAVVQAGGDVIVNDAILHSRVSAGGKISVEGRRGVVTGGHLMAGSEITLHTAGTHLAPSTLLEVGVDPAVKEEYRRIRDELQRLTQVLDQTHKALTILKAVDPACLPPDKREMLLRLTKTQFQLAGSSETIRKRILEIEALFEDMRTGRVRVQDTVFPGVKIVIGNLVRPIRETAKHASFYLDSGEIKLGPYA